MNSHNEGIHCQESDEHVVSMRLEEEAEFRVFGAGRAGQGK